MSSTLLYAVILLACALTFSAAQTSCKGRCGSEYYRGFMCQCDYSCLTHGECCKDFESQCTTENSCKGRCGENFKRGRLCSCDSDCMKYKQCCPDYKSHCDAEELTLNEATEQDSTFSKGNNADDHLIPMVSPTSYPQDVDDMYGQIFPNDGFSNKEVEDPEASPIPESTSGYGSSTADLLDRISTEPTHDPETMEFSTKTFTVVSLTQMTLSHNELTQTDDSPSTKSKDATTSSPDPGTTLPQATTAAYFVSSQPITTSVPQTEASPTANTPELETVGQAEIQPEDDIFPKAQNTEPTGASTDKPEVTTLPSTIVPYPPVASVSTGPTQVSSTVLENSLVTTLPASSMPDLTPIPEATTSNPEPDDTQNNAEDVTTDPSRVTPEGSGNLSELDVPTTHIPSSTEAVQDGIADDVTPGVTTADPLNVTPDPTKPTPYEATTKPQVKPDPYKPNPAKPSSKPGTKPLDTAQTLIIDDPRNYQGDENNDTNLCSGRPVSAVTTLRNGTMVVFRGHYFWFLDRNRAPGQARGITQVWGVPSPIDTVFTRCNCQGKTYIFKGVQYWRFENDVLDPDYPKVIETGFDGLRGHITAALSVPQYQRRRESVYFFKRGGQVQKYSYQFGTSPTCSRKPQYANYTGRNRMVRQAVSLLGPTVNIRTSWEGFPSTITAAVSMPNKREPEGYKYVVFSRSKSYNVRMDSERPVIAAPATNASPQSSDLFKCTKKV
ncbi:proteoglycan 4b isoform X2 [Micropterus dolomieu]|uniref:proteoglycan 4b isoform X2 n=1 Tax=Micropterus dolomieu TaxID=147949 RepID=UPI001E8DB174|nr:proteoglycan 4b isoform X2 [Micropterus dolomieu]